MKDYLCKDCQFNNYGWCDKLKFNGLKRIIECEYKKEQDCSLKVEGVKEPQAKTKTLADRGSNEAYKSMGKREIFYTIQRELNAMSDSSTILDVKKVMVNLEQLLLISEGIHGIQTECEIDKDVVNASKLISRQWKKDTNKRK